jgi:hypothetical protein
MPNTEIRTEFLLIKTRATPGISKSVIAGYYLSLSTAGYNYIGQGPHALGAKPSDGVLDFSSLSAKLENPYFLRI